MNQINPMVSVLMTAYNREKFIKESIESVLLSSYTNWELIIVDDCSNDNTVEIAKTYEQSDRRIRLFINEKNLGDYPNRNKAAKLARGEYMYFLDSDDKIFPTSLEKLISHIKDHTQFKFGMYCNQFKGVSMIDGSLALKRHFFETQFLFIGPGGTIMKTDFFHSLGGYPEKYGPANDMYFNLKACCFSSIYLIQFDFFYYRRHEGQEINNKYGYLYNNYNYMRDALNDLPLPFSKKQISWLQKKNKRRFLVQLFKYFYSTCDYRKTYKAYIKTEFSFFDILQAVFH